MVTSAPTVDLWPKVENHESRILTKPSILQEMGRARSPLLAFRNTWHRPTSQKPAQFHNRTYTSTNNYLIKLSFFTRSTNMGVCRRQTRRAGKCTEILPVAPNTKTNLGNNSQSNLSATQTLNIYLKSHQNLKYIKIWLIPSFMECIKREKTRLNYQVRFILLCTVCLFN
jgi:hypothetical protein